MILGGNVTIAQNFFMFEQKFTPLVTVREDLRCQFVEKLLVLAKLLFIEIRFNFFYGGL